MALNTDHFKAKLEAEKEALEAQLSNVASKDPANPSNWEPKPGSRDSSEADENLVADSIEDYEENTAITNALEARYNDIKSGLDKIKHGVYGICQVCKKEIEEDRLEANPAARTCKEHMNTV